MIKVLYLHYEKYEITSSNSVLLTKLKRKNTFIKMHVELYPIVFKIRLNRELVEAWVLSLWFNLGFDGCNWVFENNNKNMKLQ